MADEPVKRRKRRIVRDPETFRERAVKAAESSDKPSRTSRLKVRGGRVVKPVIRPFGKLKSRKVFRSRPFRWLGIVLRFLAKITFLAYLRNSWRELKLVTWPNWRESRRLTVAVLIFAIIFGAVIAGVDYGLDKLFKNILLK